MTPSPSLDRVRAYVEETMSPSERAEFSAEVASDRGLADAVALYAEVRAGTDDPAPPCRMTAEALVLDDASPPFALASARSARSTGSTRVAAAAAILLVTGAAAAWYVTRPTTPSPTIAAAELALDGIPLEPTAVLPETPPLAASTLAAISRYEPAPGASLASLDDLDVARAVAAATRRPLLAFVYHPTCPWCQAISKGPFHDAAIAAAAEPFVFVRLDVTKTPESVWSDFDVWPIFWVEDARGVRKHVFGGEQTSASLARELAAATAAAPVPDGVLSWPTARDAARGLSETDPARRYAAAVLAATNDPQGVLGANAAAIVAAETEAARRALESGRTETARGGVPAGLAALDAAIPRFRGTPLGRDLERVRARLAADRAFPRLTRAARTAPEGPR